MKQSKLKNKAIYLRKTGFSLRYIANHLHLSKSTVSVWLRNIKLTQSQKKHLINNWKAGLVKARIKAAQVNKQAKRKRIETINKDVNKLFKQIKINNPILEIFLSSLFLGEGFKKEGKTAMGSLNPEILKSFVTLLRILYKTDQSKFRAAIYARADQNINSLINYWSKLLKISPSQFHKTQVDKRTRSKKTYPDYKGVCAVYYYDTSIQRRLLSISKKMLEYINSKEP